MLVSPVAAVGPAVKPRAIGAANAMAIIVCEVSVERLDVGHGRGWTQEAVEGGQPGGASQANAGGSRKPYQGIDRNSAAMVRTAMVSEDGMALPCPAESTWQPSGRQYCVDVGPVWLDPDLHHGYRGPGPSATQLMRAPSRTGPWPPSRARGGETRQTPGISIRSDAIRQSGLGELDMRAFLMCVPFALGQRSGLRGSRIAALVG